MPDRITFLHAHEVELVDDPIEPGWVLEGSPRVRSSRWATSADGTTSSYVWECTAGRFRWFHAEDETVHVVEGEVAVCEGDRAPRTLRAGDAALFQAGTWTEWHVERYVRKHAVLRPHLPRPVALLARASVRLGRRRVPVG